MPSRAAGDSEPAPWRHGVGTNRCADIGPSSRCAACRPRTGPRRAAAARTRELKRRCKCAAKPRASAISLLRSISGTPRLVQCQPSTIDSSTQVKSESPPNTGDKHHRQPRRVGARFPSSATHDSNRCRRS